MMSGCSAMVVVSLSDAVCDVREGSETIVGFDQPSRQRRKSKQQGRLALSERGPRDVGRASGLGAAYSFQPIRHHWRVSQDGHIIHCENRPRSTGTQSEPIMSSIVSRNSEM